jgi:O-antigen ligase
MSTSALARPGGVSQMGSGDLLWRRILEWTVTLYTISTLIEGAIFTVGSARVARFVAPLLIVVVALYALFIRMPRFINVVVIGQIGVLTLVSLTALTSEYPEEVMSRLRTFGMLATAGAALAAALAILGARGITCVQRGLIIGAGLSSLLIIAARAKGDFVGASEFERNAGRATAGFADPNDLALALAIALPACLWSKHWLPKYVVAPIVVAAIFFTGSRGGLVALGAGSVAAVVVMAQSAANPFKTTVRAVGLTLIPILTTWTLLPERLTERFMSLPEELASGTFTRRTLYWRAAWDQFSENPFWGAGSGSAQHFNYLRTGRNQVFHNTYLSYLVELGLLGWLFFFLALCAAWIGAIRSSRSFGWPVVSMTIMTVGIVALSWDAKKLMWVLLITCGALLYNNNNKEKLLRSPQRQQSAGVKPN